MKKSMCLIVAALIVSACQATTDLAGKQPLTLFSAEADVLEKYLNDPDGMAIAVTLDGNSSYAIRCSWVRCDYETGSPEKEALERCEKRKRKCRVFAIRDQIVWSGPVTISSRASGNYLLRVIKMVRSDERQFFTGYATPKPGSDQLHMSIQLERTPCTDTLDPNAGRWSLGCNDGTLLEGRAERGTSSIYWGMSDKDNVEINVVERGWPLLEEKLKARGLYVEQRTTSSDRLTTESIGTNGSLNWPEHASRLYGNIEREPNARKGSLTFASDDKTVTCSGEFEVMYGERGFWSLACGDIRAKGDLRVSGQFINGSGATDDGKPVRFVGKP